MSEFIKIPADELERLKNRIKSLSHEKAQLQLLYELISQLSPGAGLKKTIQSILHLLMNTIGGTNLIIYYKLDNNWYSLDINGEENIIITFDDPLVKQAIENKNFIEGPGVDSLMTNVPSGSISDGITWHFPLIIGQEIIGVIKLEGIRMLFDENIRKQLQVFINYISLVLQNELMNFSKLKVAYEDVRELSEVNAAMSELASTLITSPSINNISYLVMEFAKRFTNSKFGYVGYIEQETGHLVIPTLTRDIWDICKVEDKTIVFEEFRGLFGWVLNERKTLMTNNASEDPRSTGTPEGHIPIKKFLSAPALIDEDLAGQVAVANSDNDYTEKEQTIIERLAALYSIAIQRYRSEDKIREYSENLEQNVKERTKELEEKNKELEHFNQLFMDREFRIKELRDKVKELEGK